MTNINLHFIEVMENTDRATIFGKAIREKRKEQRLTVEAAAKKIGISKQYLSVLERAVPSLYTGKSIVPKLETVDSIAEALNWDIDEARLAAGYAPTSTHYVGGFEIQLPDDVTAVIPHSQITSESEAAEFREAFLLAYEITKKRIADRDKEK